MRSIRFLGAAGTVTGSKHLLSANGVRVLIDCGLFQGPKLWRERNWQPLPAPVESIQSVVLTHAHLDHTGYLPRLARDGFHGPVHCSPATADLCAILLADSGRLQEEDAVFRNRHGLTRHQPALPLYTEQDAQAALRLLRPAGAGDENAAVQLGPDASFVFHRAAHILGSRFVDLTLGSGAERRRVLFTGDIGRPRPGGAASVAGGPAPIDDTGAAGDADPAVDYLVMESTYGDRLHPEVDIRPRLAAVLRTALARGGTVVIPAFAVERTEKVLFLLKHLIEEGAIPRVPIDIDSPMAVQAVDAFLKYRDEFDADTRDLIARFGSPHEWPDVHFDLTPQQSKALNDSDTPRIILSSSGMATGGRVLHHLARRLSDARNLVMFVGYQSPGTLGQRLRDGENPVRIHQQPVSVRAQVTAFEQFSDHADYQETLTWLRGFHRPPRATFLVHGDPSAAAALRERIHSALGWHVQVAEWLQEVALD